MASFPKIVPLRDRPVRPSTPAPQPRKEYQVLIPDRTEVGGLPVVMHGNDKTVKMTELQAEFWVDQGVLREQPRGETVQKR